MGETMTFEQAMVKLKAGAAMARTGWNGPDMYVAAQFPDEHSKMQRPYLYIVPNKEWMVPWQPSQWDIFCDDWYVVKEANGNG